MKPVCIAYLNLSTVIFLKFILIKFSKDTMAGGQKMPQSNGLLISEICKELSHKKSMLFFFSPNVWSFNRKSCAVLPLYF